jgi:hypothetical protein
MELPQLESLLHCLVRIVPVAHDTPLFEPALLRLDRIIGEIARRGTDCDCISVAEGFLRGLQRFDLDGEAVAVPAGDIRDFIALGDMETADDIFGDFI